MIKVNNIVKKYSNKGGNVLDDVSFTISEGESVAILGANGSGKTTLVEIIAGVIEPTSGKVTHSEDENASFNAEKSNNELKTCKKNMFFNKVKDSYIQKNVGIQFQSGSWPFNTKPSDLLNFFFGRTWKKSEYISELIDVFEVKNMLYKRIARCSGGEQQRFNCLLSIINKPKILVLDELITGLDLKMQIKLINFFTELRKKEKITLIVVSHIPEEVERMSDRLILLKDGKVFKDFKTNQVKSNYGSVRVMLENFFGETL